MKCVVLTGLICLSLVSLTYADESHKEIYDRFLNCEFDYFLDKSPTNSLALGLRLMMLGQYSRAEELLLQVIPGVDDSLRSAILTDLAYSNYAQQKWARGNSYVNDSDPGYDVATNPYEPFSKYPLRKLVMTEDSISVEFIDDFFARTRINGNDSSELIILDTGAPTTVISNRLAAKYGLWVDSTEHKAQVTGFQTPTAVHCALLERMTLGSVELLNVPVIILDDAVFDRMGLSTDAILGLTEMMAFDAVRFDYPNNRVRLIRRRPTSDISPNFAVVDLRCVLRVDVGKSPVAAMLDTGSPFTYLIASDLWDTSNLEVVRSEKKTYGDYTFDLKYYSFPLLVGDALEGIYEIQILPRPSPLERHRVDCLLGNDLWNDKVLDLDFRNRIVSFQ